MIGEKKPVKEYAVTRYVSWVGGGGGRLYPRRWGDDGARPCSYRGDRAPCRRRGPEPESAQSACATAPKPVHTHTPVTVGSDTSIRIGSIPWDPSLPWKSSEWMPVPFTESDVPGVNSAPSRLYSMPGAPLIVTETVPVNHPFVCGPVAIA